MNGSFLIHYILAMGALGVFVLCAHAAARRWGSRSDCGGKSGRLIAVVASAGLAHNGTLHVVRIGKRYFALAVNPRCAGALHELPVDDLTCS